MRNNQVILILASALVIFTCILLLSLHPDSENYILEGRVYCPDSSPVSLDVYVTQEKEFPRGGFEGLHRVRTLRDGIFKTEYHARIGDPIYFYVVKKGIKPVRHEYFPKAYKGRNQTLDETINFAPLHEKLGAKELYGKKRPELPVYSIKCGTEPDNHIPLDDILFVENLNHFFCNNDGSTHWEGKIKTKRGMLSPTFFQPLSTGGIYKALSPSITENK